MAEIATLHAASNDDTAPLEYDCQDCGGHTVCCVWMPHHRERRCLVCSYVAGVADDADRAMLRKALSLTGLPAAAMEELR